MSQSHFTLSFPLRSPADAKALAQELPPLMPDLFRAEDATGQSSYPLKSENAIPPGDFSEYLSCA